MRLIDADALIEAMKKTESEYENAMTCPSWWSAFNVISEQPTAYDIDKVVEELEIERKTANNTYNSFNMDVDLGRVFGLEKAIEIVKQEAEKFGTDINVVSNGWIPCSERLPEIDGNTSDTVLVCGSNGFLYMAFWCDDLQWRFCECGMAKEPVLWTEIVAWQPLPEPFKERD